MTRPISMDLRERVMARLGEGKSVWQVAAALDVARSSVMKSTQRLRATGNCAPAKFGGWRSRKIVGDQGAWLPERIEAPCVLDGPVIGGLLDRFSLAECANYFENAGYTSK